MLVGLLFLLALATPVGSGLCMPEMLGGPPFSWILLMRLSLDAVPALLLLRRTRDEFLDILLKALELSSSELYRVRPDRELTDLVCVSPAACDDMSVASSRPVRRPPN